MTSRQESPHGFHHDCDIDSKMRDNYKINRNLMILLCVLSHLFISNRV